MVNMSAFPEGEKQLLSILQLGHLRPPFDNSSSGVMIGLHSNECAWPSSNASTERHYRSVSMTAGGLGRPDMECCRSVTEPAFHLEWFASRAKILDGTMGVYLGASRKDNLVWWHDMSTFMLQSPTHADSRQPTSSLDTETEILQLCGFSEM